MSLMSVRHGSGCDVRGAPIKKCPGVSADRSLGSEDISDKGLEFRHASMDARIVDSSSKL